MYTLYTDKQEIFECSISLEGASVKNSQARLIVETDHLNLLFKGTINESGKCTIPIKRLKNLIDESSTGQIRLEVIADDTYFTPWESKFNVKTAKKLTVEVATQSNKVTLKESVPVVTVKTTQQPIAPKHDNSNMHIANISKILRRSNININNMQSNKYKLNKIIEAYMQVRQVASTEKTRIIEGIIQTLIKQ
jgi:glycine cleavage system regulatory protein